MRNNIKKGLNYIVPNEKHFCLFSYYKLKCLKKKQWVNFWMSLKESTFYIPDGEKIGFGLHNFDSQKNKKKEIGKLK